MDYFLRIGVGCVMFGLLGCAFDSDGVGGDGGASVGGSSSGSNSATDTEPSTTASSASGTSAMTSSQESSGGGETSASTTDPSTTAPTTTVDPTGMTTLETTGAADSSGGQDASGGSSGDVGPDPYSACSEGCLEGSICAELYDEDTPIADVCAPPCGELDDCPGALSGGAELICPGGFLYCLLVCGEGLPCPDGMDCEGTQYGNRCFWPL